MTGKEFHQKILDRIQSEFSTFGSESERKVFNNPIAVALKDSPLQFVAGVDVSAVVLVVMEEVLNAIKEGVIRGCPT